jgi:hypothetical protein
MKTDTHPDELLTWYVNGTLELSARVAVEQHLTDCARCRDEVVFLRALRHGVKAVSGSDVPGELGLKRLLREVRGTPAPKSSTWWKPALAVAALLIVVQGTLLSIFWPQDATITPLGGHATEGVLQVQFHPNTTEAQIRRLLTEEKATFVDGPSALGIYQIRAERLQPTLDELRKRTDIVKHVATE